jgi:hypothetical protein
MRIRWAISMLLAGAVTSAWASGPVTTGFVERGELWMRGIPLAEREVVPASGMLESGAAAARIALEHGGTLELGPGSQIRLDTAADGVVVVTVVRGEIVLETTSGKRLSAGRNSVFRLERDASSAGIADAPDLAGAED